LIREKKRGIGEEEAGEGAGEGETPKKAREVTRLFDEICLEEEEGFGLVYNHPSIPFSLPCHFLFLRNCVFRVLLFLFFFLSFPSIFLGGNRQFGWI